MAQAKSYDVLIVGGGVIGLSIARSLRKKGVKDIAILERGELGREASYAAAGILAPQAEANRADDFFHFCRASNDIYPRFAAELKDETGHDIELAGSGTLYLAFSEQDIAEISRRFNWQTAAALAVERFTGNEIRKMEPHVSGAVREGLLFPADQQVENRKLLDALKRFAELNDIDLFEHSEVQSLIADHGGVRGIETDGQKFFARTTVLATGAWTSFIKLGKNVVPVSVKPIRGQMVCFQPPSKLFRSVVYSPRGYIVPRADGRVLVGATVEDAGFDKSVTEDGVRSLVAEACNIAPALTKLDITDSWAGLRPASTDGLPILGELPETLGLVMATGHFRNGILLAPITAEIISDYIVSGINSAFLDVFGPQRLRTAATFS